MKKRILAIVTVVLLCLLVVACGDNDGSGGISNGRFVPRDAMVGMIGYSSFEFRGNRVTVGMMNDAVTHNRLSYTHENDTLSFTLEGATINLSLEIVDNNTLLIQGAEFIRE